MEDPVVPGVNGVANGTPTSPAPSSVEPQTIIKYLTGVLEVTLGATDEELRAPGSLLNTSQLDDTVSRCMRFALEQQMALYVLKQASSTQTNGTVNGDGPEHHDKYVLSSEVSYSSGTVGCVAFLKRPTSISPDVPISKQISVVNLSLSGLSGSDSGSAISPYESLHSFVRGALTPFFEAAARGSEAAGDKLSRTDGEARTGISGARRKLADLEITLQNLQQNIEVEAPRLQIHEAVQAQLAEANGDPQAAAIQIPDSLVTDSTLLNRLQSMVNEWIKQIRDFTRITDDPDVGTTSQEKNFWLTMESAIEGIEAQLASGGVSLTMKILEKAKRHGITASFQSDTRLKETKDKVQRYNQLFQGFPIEELLSATSVEKLRDALDDVFNHFNKKLRICPYPIKRALALVEAISGDLDSRLHDLLHGRALMHADFREFSKTVAEVQKLWIIWDDDLKEFTNVARDVTRRRHDKFVPIKITKRHDKTQDRISYIYKFRDDHEQLQKTIATVLGPDEDIVDLADGPTAPVIVEEMGDVDAAEEITQAYTAVKDVDVLDISPEGERLWTQAEAAYNERTARVENSIIARLRDRLAVAKSANEMFRVFSKFNALFVRPKIKGAIAEYQVQLMNNVREDIDSLQKRFTHQYGQSEAHGMAQLHDLPPISGAIIRARQIERQLNNYLGKVEDILGPQWKQHTEGAKLNQLGEGFRRKLDTKPIVDDWLRDIGRRHLSISGRLFSVTQNRARGNVLEINVNFDSQLIILFKEVRNLHWLNCVVPHAISNVSKEARRVYPFAVSLMESLNTYAQTNLTIENMTEVTTLLSGYRNGVQGFIGKGAPLRWDTFVLAYDVHVRHNNDGMGGSGDDKLHVQFVRNLGNSIATLQSKVTTLSTIQVTVESTLRELQSCPFTNEAFSTHLETLQRAIDQLNLETYSNIPYWVSKTNERVVDTLHARLQQALKDWTEDFENGYSAEQQDQREPGSPNIETFAHDILMQSQLIQLDPPLEDAKTGWLENLNNWLATVCSLPRLQASRFENALTIGSTAATKTYSELPIMCMGSLAELYDRIEAKLSVGQTYVDEWLQFQSLWDLQLQQIQDDLGEELDLWLQLILEIRQKRETFDTSGMRRSFGHLIINYEQVQSKVNAKYDQWQHDLLAHFSAMFATRLVDVFSELQRARKDLEGQSMQATSTSQAVSFITVVQTCKRQTKVWEPEMDTFRQGQQTLSRLRFQYPKDWLYVEQVDHEWTALMEVLDKKSKQIADHTEGLRSKIITEDGVVSRRIAEMTEKWREERPESGSIPPAEATTVLDGFDTELTQLQEQSEMVSKAKEALELPAGPDNALADLLAEVQDYKSVWANLTVVWEQLNDLRDQPWNSVQPRKLRQAIDNLIKTTKEMPSRMRSYAAFEHLQSVLRQLLKVNPLLTEMRSDAVRERHWQKIFKNLQPSKRYSAISMTLGDVWDLQLGPSESVIRDVIAQAQGEMALEEFVRSVREHWQNYTLDLVNYQNKCRLIRGWDDLFAKCSDHLNSLQAMRHSPYYKEFEEEASSWEDKLNRIHVLFDVWIDVQRQWVYLEGVFTGNADIKHLLPVESSRFANINSEFMNVLKKVYRSPQVLEVLNIPDVQRSLERLADLLNKIQKALGEYLEKERVAFPRFYFVGDEDLLEIIGNSNDTLRIAKHLRKMFAGVSGVVMDEESIISGLTSREGETVMLRNPISLIQTPKINDWLRALENGMRETLSELLVEAVAEYEALEQDDQTGFESYIYKYPAQIVVLATQAHWTSRVGAALQQGADALQKLFEVQVNKLKFLAASVLKELEPVYRKKCEQLITEFVHQRDTIEKLINGGADSPGHYLWLLQMRYDFDASAAPLERMQVRVANATLAYGFEYLGVPERLVRTPLTDRCFLTLSQALCQRLGGSPYGPAGTGKTESVKALGVQLGRFTLVFNCDDTFDFQAMGRIFLGISQVGAWGCFDEFNRLEERILSAVSQQIQNIQVGLRKRAQDASSEIDLLGRSLKVHPLTGMFITMNPGYAGRSNLPDNLKKLFRSVAMSKPDKEIIAEVMLFSQGFSEAKTLSRQTVPFFDKCSASLSKQPHYDFGLRALKSVLVSSGGLKRTRLADGDAKGADSVVEPQIIVQSIRETIAPKLVRDDALLMAQIEGEAFPGVQYVPASLEQLRGALQEVVDERKLVATDSWLTKVLQLYQIQHLHHGVMMVGNSGTGKSTAWQALLAALQKVDGVEGVCHVIDPKVMSKESLYGSLDSTTREWTDGLFTSILRKVVDNLRGEDSKRHWIIFDGDVDPEWVENLNSVLDDNKLLTLPNGERLGLPSNVRVMFEVETLRYATLATVSRCGMVWFSDDTVDIDVMLSRYIAQLRTATFEDLEEDTGTLTSSEARLATQNLMAEILNRRLTENDFVRKAIDHCASLKHIMEFTSIRAIGTLFSLLRKSCRSVLEYNIQHTDFPLNDDQVEAYLSKKVLLAAVWSFTGDCPLVDRKAFGDYLAGLATLDMPVLTETTSLIDYDVTLPEAAWSSWQNQVPTIEVNTHSVTQTDLVIPTLDTVRHEDVLYSFLAEHKPLLLCGPPGSGKTMTLFSALRKLPNMEVVGLNFSSATTPDLLVKTLEQYCDYKKSLSGVTMAPRQIGRWLVVFCDEINLPAPDKYGTQRVISFLRQLVEHGGFWRTTTKSWVSLERIQFVGACNPPTDAGRTPLGLRFLRHAPLIMVDYPGELSLKQIYGTFNNAVMKIIPTLRGYADALTQAMIKVYLQSQKRFTPDIQPHYVYSPRELTRWVRAIYEAIRPLETLSLEGLVRIWAHEALRLFSDRLIADDERQWTEDTVNSVALEHFPNIDEEAALQRPILFSNWLSKNYVPVHRDQLRDFVKARLRTFCEEELDVPLILFNDVLEHVLRIDRVFRQPQGHLILIGVSGSGKTTLSRFVAWMNGLSVFQIKVHGRYSSEDFDEDLRNVLRRCGCKGEKICFIMDESNVLDSGFLERMNTLLANGEVPGLFEGDEYATLMTACKEGAQRQGLLLDSQEELYKWFTQQIVRNLHVVFTMNPPSEGLGGKAATSPALFNRCVLNWFGDWSDQALYQVAFELTQSVDIDKGNYSAPDSLPIAFDQLEMPLSHRDAVVNAMVHVHHSLRSFNDRLKRQQNKTTFLTPRQFLDFVAQFVKLFNEKRDDLEEQQRHLNVGLDKLRETVEKVSELKKSLAEKKSELERKDAEASEKLQRMVADQREAEQRRATSLDIQAALEKQEKVVGERREVVLNDLAKAEPAVEEAQRSVSNIKRQHLTEVRSMQNPPQGVKLALEAVCTLLGHKAPDWKTIVGIVRRDDFIASIVNYDNEKQMTAQHRAKMKADYISKEDEFTFERVNRASKACGPLVQWVHAQVNYSEILDRVGPLREEVDQLQEEALQTKAEAKAIENTLQELEQSISTYKSEYASLISQTEAIKAEMSRVQSKVDRSMRLLNSLSSERGRWEEGSKTFQVQMETIIGDVFLASGFLAYAGFYDQQYRRAMLEDWSLQLSSSGIAFKAQNALSEYLSTADERQQWHDNGLPVDELCTENAIMLKRYNRYPLIIDPSGRVTEFLQNESKERRLTVTSFLDSSFVKQLESALRFGNPILIQDAEHIDPILNHVLNKEYQRTGGRVLIQLGRQEIDFSPAFKLYLSTRDPSAPFAPDVCSRTTFVNFTVTQSSLKTQTLNDVLKSERPDVDERRSNLVKMQGEFTQRLRRLERMLLQALNESRGNILDDENVIQTLETLKNEAAEITAKASETEGVMNEVNSIMSTYDIIARSCSAIFAVLEQLYHVHHFYQFSLQYFVDIFETVLKAARESNDRDPKKRIDSIVRSLFSKTYNETSASLLQKDSLTFAVLLAQAAPFPMDKSYLDTLLDESFVGSDVNHTPEHKEKALGLASRVKGLKDIVASADTPEWTTFLTTERAEECVPGVAQTGGSDNDKALKELVLVKLFRMDRLVPATERFINIVFGQDFLDVAEDLGRIARDTTASSPIALCSSPGFDASYKVDQLVERTQASCTSVAMGSNESVSSADAALAGAAANGSWVLIKNVHLATEWLQNLVKRIDSLKPHKDFRLFLSMETSPKIPSSLLRASRVLMYEQPAGIRANMRDTLTSLPDKAVQQPVEKARVHFLLSFLHAVVQERLRYAPRLGWKGFWEFNDADFDCSAFVIQWWTDNVARGRSNVAPKSIPWDMLRELIAEMYGGKVDDAGDMAVLKDLVGKTMTADAFEEGFNLIGAVAEDNAVGAPLPSGTAKSVFLQWVKELPEREPPTYLGLPANAEKLLLVAHADEMLRNLKTVMGVLDEGEHVMAEAVEE
ncbi:hypothetical protein PRZ48_014586 [Zasmidium cellare]|uniref:Dynein heavy chain, cytoplasmic n=1 Tax=Zasmidium cellare TaxID=395010 RepID=A0ABR0DZ77_ZASCE|nr:hypothetical protein PRZ48_014586 [Zasmidium cellare]